MRIYVPATPAMLVALKTDGVCSAQMAFTAGPDVYQAYSLELDDIEIAEYLAMSLAAEDLGDGPILVIAADVPDVAVLDGGEIGQRQLVDPLKLTQVASFHAGDASPSDEDDGPELSWWAVQELPVLLATLD
ncbi:MAG: hypothetical protein EBS41_01560 [Actinobacteria bacterium]|nr:hypothetical protein [Actinomycetota bacterium]